MSVNLSCIMSKTNEKPKEGCGKHRPASGDLTGTCKNVPPKLERDAQGNLKRLNLKFIPSFFLSHGEPLNREDCTNGKFPTGYILLHFSDFYYSTNILS